MSTLPKPHLTPEEYLEIERKAEFKSEYYRGEMFAMAGAREGHNLIVGNAYLQLREQLAGRPRRVYATEMRVQVQEKGLYTYPDVVVVCGERRFRDEERDTLLNPMLIIEVLSKSTEAYDRGQKFEYYRALASLSDYLLVESERIAVELFTRQPDGRWLLATAGELENTIEIPSIRCSLALPKLYQDVEFRTAG